MAHIDTCISQPASHPDQLASKQENKQESKHKNKQLSNQKRANNQGVEHTNAHTHIASSSTVTAAAAAVVAIAWFNFAIPKCQCQWNNLNYCVLKCVCVCMPVYMSRLYGTLIMVLESFIHPSIHAFARSFVRMYGCSCLLNVFLLYILFIFQIFRSLEEPFEKDRFNALRLNVTRQRAHFIANLTQLMDMSDSLNRTDMIETNLKNYEEVCMLFWSEGCRKRNRKRKIE